MSDVNTHDESNYEFMSAEFEAALLADVLAMDGFDARHQGDGTILFSDSTGVETVNYRMTIERLD